MDHDDVVQMNEQPDSQIMLAVYLAFPQVENLMNSIRTTEGSRRARKEGCWTGIAPIGYNNKRDINEKSTLEPNLQSEVVKKAFAEMAKGIYSAEEVRRNLRKEGLKLSKNQFLNMLRSVVYTGHIYIKPWKKEKEEIVLGLHDGLINEETFNKVQQILMERGRKLKIVKRKPEFPLRNFLICPKCNKNLTASASRSHNGTLHYYYHCQKGCNVRFRADSTNEKFIKYLKRINTNETTIKIFKEILAKVYFEKEVVYKKKKNELEVELVKIQELIHSAEDKFYGGNISREDFQDA
jgi:site-specific DNA recombinase